MKKSFFFRIKYLGFILIVFFIGLLIVPNQMVKQSSKKLLYSSEESIPHNKVGLLLGTSKFLSDSRINLYYQYRIEAACVLFKSGKIDYILVSGDNSRKEYDEPSMMKHDLISKGIPESRIFLDYAGFRTLDSVIRCKTIFGQNSITVISQPFHNERAIYLAKRNDMKAIEFNAKEVTVLYGFKTKLRERIARVKMMIDLIVGKQPKFGGEKIDIE